MKILPNYKINPGFKFKIIADFERTGSGGGNYNSVFHEHLIIVDRIDNESKRYMDHEHRYTYNLVFEYIDDSSVGRGSIDEQDLIKGISKGQIIRI